MDSTNNTPTSAEDYLLKETRHTKGFLDPKETMVIIGTSNTVLDPYSVLISKNVSVGTGNILYPNVVIECADNAKITIGNDNVFYPGTYLLSSTGSISIGDNNELGMNGCTIRANSSEAAIRIGSGGRYCDGANIMGQSNLGDGSQILGNIIVQSCTLAPGSTYQVPDPNERGAVLKGFGIARNLTLEKGLVINGAGDFASSPTEWQRDYHSTPSV